MRLKKDFTFSDGGTVKVHEISSADLDDFQIRSLEASQVTYDDKALGVFAQAYYPILSACTENPPSLEEAYKKEPCDLDNWFLLCSQLNDDWLGKKSYTEEEIKLNGKKIVVKSYRPSIQIRYAQLEQKTAKEKPLDNLKDEEYRLNGYLAVAAASFGNIPTAYQAKHDLSLKDFSLWHKTVRNKIPEWYLVEGETSQPEQATETKKKSESAQGNYQIS